ncbi:hypothetical protein PS6_011696, partial [Mucor atramentarius]
LKNLKNQFEIEERVLSLLKSEEHIKRTTSGQFTTTDDDRLKINKARNQYWNNLAYSFALKYFGENNIKNINNYNMNEQGGSSSSATGDSSNIVKLAEILKEVILAKNSKDDNFDFLERPKSYNGSRRDPFIIESWIQTLEDFASVKNNYDNDKTAKLGITLLTGAAKVWYQNLRLLNSAPTCAEVVPSLPSPYNQIKRNL